MSAECDIHGCDLVYGTDWPAMFCQVCEVDARAAIYEAALTLIAAERRADGTYNRDREACGELAREALAQASKDTSAS